jgi:hypothetical protein
MKRDKFVQLENVNALVFFKGTETEKAEEERKELRNVSKLKSLYKSIIAGKIQALYIRQGKHTNGMELYYILHPSAKYECLQCTAVMFKNDEYFYMCGDHKTPDFDDFLKESAYYGMDGKKVYYF